MYGPMPTICMCVHKHMERLASKIDTERQLEDSGASARVHKRVITERSQ